jgi:hypothetical protein
MAKIGGQVFKYAVQVVNYAVCFDLFLTCPSGTRSIFDYLTRMIDARGLEEAGTQGLRSGITP